MRQCFRGNAYGFQGDRRIKSGGDGLIVIKSTSCPDLIQAPPNVRLDLTQAITVIHAAILLDAARPAALLLEDQWIGSPLRAMKALEPRGNTGRIYPSGNLRPGCPRNRER